MHVTLTRRRFLTRSGLLAAGGLLGPGLFANPLVQRALAETLGDRYFVIVFLDGGNDGLNTVTPVDDGSTGALRAAYEQARDPGGGGLRLPASQLLLATSASAPPLVDASSGTPLGFHPGLRGLRALYDLGKVAVIQGCGYPRYSLSHDESRRVWERATPYGGALPGGWLGRYLAANYGGADIPGVNVSSSLAGEFVQSTTSILTVDRVRDFGFPYDQRYSSDVADKRAAFLALCEEASASGHGELAYVGASARATLLSSESYPALHDLYEDARASFDAAYEDLGTSLAEDLREVAKVIYGVASGVPNVGARFFQVRNGGYDTHSDQGAGEADGQHTRLHRELGDALETFYADCADMGVADKVCVLVWSEFSRRIEQNDNGTDHGSQGPVFVVGGAVQGGVYGNHPDVRPASLDDDGNTAYSQGAGDPFRSTDLRDVYGTILTRWLGMPAGTVLGGVLPVDGGDPAESWTAPNLDLGFL
jgi:uncharacterized protein (DUF1501 family)